MATSKKKKRKRFNPDTMPRIVRNRYFIVSISFFIWILVFDRNNIITQVKLQRALNEKHRELKYYQDQIEEVRADRAALFSDDKSLEQYARERYKFKKDNEDVFIIERK